MSTIGNITYYDAHTGNIVGTRGIAGIYNFNANGTYAFSTYSLDFGMSLAVNFVGTYTLDANNVITMAPRQDRLSLGSGIRFKDLDIVQRGSKTLISLNNDAIAVLIGVRANQITAADLG